MANARLQYVGSALWERLQVEFDVLMLVIIPFSDDGTRMFPSILPAHNRIAGFARRFWNSWILLSGY
jgi:hypothetical protein